jgi:antitoxin VapB
MVAVVYTSDTVHGRDLWYILVREVNDRMAETGIAKLFRNGRSQAVRLPREFRFEGVEVRVRRVAKGVLLEPLIADPAKWFAKLDQIREGYFLDRGKGRNQPVTPRREIFR